MKLISAFVFATQIVQSLFFLNPKFQASSCLLWLYSLVCVGPVQKPHCWFSHEMAQIPITGHKAAINGSCRHSNNYVSGIKGHGQLNKCPDSGVLLLPNLSICSHIRKWGKLLTINSALV